MTEDQYKEYRDIIDIKVERHTNGYSEVLTLSFDGGINANEFAEKLKLIMLWMTYSEKTINDVFVEAGGGYDPE